MNYIQFRVQFDVRSTEDTAVDSVTWDRMRMNLAEVCDDGRFRASVSAVRDMTLQIVSQNEEILEQMNTIIERLES